VRYVSTRGGGEPRSFADVLLDGLARDGGLYVPEAWPVLPPLADLRGRSFAEIAVAVTWPFIDGAIERLDYERIVDEAYATFDVPEVCPVIPIGTLPSGAPLHLLELYRGPTLAFKDVALQLVGRLFDHVLSLRNERICVLGATSGDTGSAAMDACAGLDRVDAFILFPAGRTSEVQRRQMTTLTAANLCAVEIPGTFDDCQDLVKAAFADTSFRDDVHLAAINSINWARVMAQITYYVTAHLAVRDDDGPVSFVVPTGNFGNVLAGWVAARGGLPVDRLVVASNRNDVLTRFFTTGTMSLAEVVPTTSPSMDIQVSSNLERLLFEVLDRDGPAVAELLGRFRGEGAVSVTGAVLDALRSEFDCGRLDDESAARVIRDVHHRTGLLLDPHTAVGLGVAEELADGGPLSDPEVPVVCLATAHPAKFPDAVEGATGIRPALPERLGDLFDLPERIARAEADLADLEDLIRQRLG